MSDYAPKYLPGDAVPITLTGTVTGGNLVLLTGVVSTDAATTVAGVATTDGISGQTIGVIRPGIHRLIAAGTIAVGGPVCAAAAGQVRAWVAGTDAVASLIGRAWSAGTASNALDVALFGV